MSEERTLCLKVIYRWRQEHCRSENDQDRAKVPLEFRRRILVGSFFQAIAGRLGLATRLFSIIHKASLRSRGSGYRSGTRFVRNEAKRRRWRWRAGRRTSTIRSQFLCLVGRYRSHQLCPYYGTNWNEPNSVVARRDQLVEIDSETRTRRMA